MLCAKQAHDDRLSKAASSCIYRGLPALRVPDCTLRDRQYLVRAPFGRFGDSWSKDNPILNLAVLLLSKTSPSASSLKGCGKADSDDFCLSDL